MRACSLITLVVCAGCAVRVPRGVGLPIAAKVAVRADVRATVDVQTRAPDVVVVPMQNAPVAEFFGIPLEGAEDVVFVLDCSGSMSGRANGRMSEAQPAPVAGPPPVDTAAGGVAVQDASAPPPDPNAAPAPAPPAIAPTKLDVAKSELVDAVMKLQGQTRVNVIFFNSGLRAYEATLFPLEAGRPGLVTFIQGQNPMGSTALAPAMRAAFLMNARRVVLLSDGLGNVGGNANSVLRDAREAMRGGVRIDTIGLGGGQDIELLGTIAGESGGLYQRL
jgi:hypothetical protein